MDGRHLISSTLYGEDVVEAGHSAVWGSLYDRESGRWGYACCRCTERRQPCAQEKRQQHGGAVGAGSESEKTSEDSEEDDARGPAPVRWRGDEAPPEEFRPRDAFDGPEHFVGHFIRYAMHQWSRVIQGDRPLTEGSVEHQDEMVRRMFRSEESLHQTQDSLAPLVQRCEDPKLVKVWRRREKDEAAQSAKAAADSRGCKMRNSSTGRGDDSAPEMTLMLRLEHMTMHAHERDYAAANKHYIELTLGKKKWHNAYHGGEGKSNKGFKLHTVSMSAPNAFDVDETVNNYIRAFRRVLLFCQMIRPNENVAKHM